MAPIDAHPAPTRTARGGWAVHRHADVSQALRDPRLAAPGQAGGDPRAHEAVRSALRQSLAAERLVAWQTGMEQLARMRLDLLPEQAAVDLVAAYAQPWSEAVALMVTGMDVAEAAACLPLAQQLYLAAACSRDGHPDATSLNAAAELARRLAEGNRQPDTLADVQAYVALSQTLPALLAGAWHALLHDPAALARLLAQPEDVPAHVPELMRLGSPAQVLFREAIDEFEIGGVLVRQGEPVELMLARANRDPQRFPEPDRIDPLRPASAQLGLGAGPHHCAGAVLVRLALTVATRELLQRCHILAAVEALPAAPLWRGGYAMGSPARLQVQARLKR